MSYLHPNYLPDPRGFPQSSFPLSFAQASSAEPQLWSPAWGR
jgi:hypothetical protein